MRSNTGKVGCLPRRTTVAQDGSSSTVEQRAVWLRHKGRNGAAESGNVRRHSEREFEMKMQKIAAFAASAITLIGLSVGLSAPAGAQDSHGGAADHRGFGTGVTRDFHGGDRDFRGGDRGGRDFHGADREFPGGDRGFVGGGREFRDRDHEGYYGGDHRVFVGGGYQPAYVPEYYGPGYVHHSWDWYQGQPYFWRAHHPYYHGSPSLGIWIRL
jgi:hypothetical protein